VAERDALSGRLVVAQQRQVFLQQRLGFAHQRLAFFKQRRVGDREAFQQQLAALEGQLLTLNIERVRLEDRLLCGICLTTEIQVYLEPCGHTAYCEALVDICPICRQPIPEAGRKQAFIP